MTGEFDATDRLVAQQIGLATAWEPYRHQPPEQFSNGAWRVFPDDVYTGKMIDPVWKYREGALITVTGEPEYFDISSNPLAAVIGKFLANETVAHVGIIKGTHRDAEYQASRHTRDARLDPAIAYLCHVLGDSFQFVGTTALLLPLERDQQLARLSQIVDLHRRAINLPSTTAEIARTERLLKAQQPGAAKKGLGIGNAVLHSSTTPAAAAPPIAERKRGRPPRIQDTSPVGRASHVPPKKPVVRRRGPRSTMPSATEFEAIFGEDNIDAIDSWRHTGALVYEVLKRRESPTSINDINSDAIVLCSLFNVQFPGEEAIRSAIVELAKNTAEGKPLQNKLATVIFEGVPCLKLLTPPRRT